MSKKLDWNQAVSTFGMFPGLIAAWVFGSSQTGVVMAGSDIDIGVFFQTSPTLDDLTSLRAGLQASFDFEDIDLVVLNQADPIIRFEVVSGQPIYCRDIAARAAFVSLAAREYESAMAFIQWGLQQVSVAA